MAQVQDELDIARNSANSISNQVSAISSLSMSNSDTANKLSTASDNMQKVAEALRAETAHFEVEKNSITDAQSFTLF